MERVIELTEPPSRVVDRQQRRARDQPQTIRKAVGDIRRCSGPTSRHLCRARTVVVSASGARCNAT